ncbi:hypothetical protein DFJ69_6485 [Thermomonospora umbrina]|uniref:Uncharacterized protein n=1 Tax=Thermomonospora umbrina TaxID=111806 RepID=A0A3D9SY61_9ACTN|nr:hypothetical protein DFJ69_6485 [Thermomonospora umbrina]
MGTARLPGTPTSATGTHENPHPASTQPFGSRPAHDSGGHAGEGQDRARPLRRYEAFPTQPAPTSHVSARPGRRRHDLRRRSSRLGGVGRSATGPEPTPVRWFPTRPVGTRRPARTRGGACAQGDPSGVVRWDTAGSRGVGGDAVAVPGGAGSRSRTPCDAVPDTRTDEAASGTAAADNPSGPQHCAHRLNRSASRSVACTEINTVASTARRGSRRVTDPARPWRGHERIPVAPVRRADSTGPVGPVADIAQAGQSPCGRLSPARPREGEGERRAVAGEEAHPGGRAASPTPCRDTPGKGRPAGSSIKDNMYYPG